MSRTLMLFLAVLLGVPGLVAAGETLQVVAVSTSPVLDGVVDPVWQQAPELLVSVSPVTADVGQRYEVYDPARRTDGREVRLRAVTNDERLFLLASWTDPTRSVVKKPWVWDAAAGAYVKGPGDEDRFAMLLPIGASATECMVSGVSFVGDLWHWKAARTEPAGYADDQTLRMGIKNFRGAETWYGPGGKTVYGKRYDDDGTAAFEEQEEPPTRFAGEQVSRYRPQQPDGSRADIRSGAKWQDGRWTLELSRALDTGDPRADRALAPGEVVQVSVAVFDDCGDMHHATSPLFSLVME
ncbi:MAG TPA: ethylbenzene dehydrogenase-related protein [Deferrisomatales bacterium]|nr:ethylbenzene dehydrogenase-related protein [Deferrisomatales bacterium]